MARPQLSALLQPRGHEEAAATLGSAPATAAGADIAPTLPPKAAASLAEVPVKPQGPVKKPKAQKATERSIPPYLRYERKEARLRTDQLTGLTVRARQLNKTKYTDSDRITDNTLIRIAVDLLLSRADELAGGDEATLRNSLGI